jgi:hypothetical protein
MDSQNSLQTAEISHISACHAVFHPVNSSNMKIGNLSALGGV